MLLDDCDFLLYHVAFWLCFQINELELKMENLQNSMDAKRDEQKKARTTRNNFIGDKDILTAWLQDAELKVQDRTSQPQYIKEALQVSLFEWQCDFVCSNVNNIPLNYLPNYSFSFISTCNLNCNPCNRNWMSWLRMGRSSVQTPETSLKNCLCKRLWTHSPNSLLW